MTGSAQPQRELVASPASRDRPAGLPFAQAPDAPARQVTVIGGGFVGAMFAHHLVRASRNPVAVDIIEPRGSLGTGLAYAASQPHQTTNIPAGRMSVYPEDRTHFERWLEAQPSLSQPQGGYPNRSSFGAYVSELLQTTEPGHPRSVLHHRQTRATNVERAARGFAVTTSGGRRLGTDTVVFATGNPVPVPPSVLAPCTSDPRVVTDPWAPGALDGVRADDHVLILGIGLTMGETITGLRAAGHRGPVLAIARRGRRFERGTLEAPPVFGNFAAPPTTAVQLLRLFRAEVRRAEGEGLSWRSVAAGVRAQAWPVWAALPVAERRRFVRHLRPYWEALRHVMPGHVHDLLQDEERLGRLRIAAASLHRLDARVDGLHATLRPRGRPVDAGRHERFDVVINCTGPAYGSLTRDDPFWAGLARSGLVAPDPVGLGVAVDRVGRALDGSGNAQPDLLVLGTLARGTFGELTGVLELSLQAREAARALVERWDAEIEPLDEPVRKGAAR